MKRFSIFWSVFFASYAFTGCGENNIAPSEAMEIRLEDIDQAVTVDTAIQLQKQNPPPPPPPQQQVATEIKTDWDKKILKTATLKAEVKNYKTFAQNLSHDVKKYGGYISNEEQNATDYQIENTVTIKVPVDRFDELVNDIAKNADKILERKISAEDVTPEYVDAKSRLEAKKHVRLQYLELLKAAKKMEDIIAVQKEINAIQEEMETVAGRINYLSQSSAMSTVYLSYSQVIDPAAKQNDEPNFLEKLRMAFLSGWHWTGKVLVGIVSVWPLLLFFVLCGVIIQKKRLLKAN